MQPEVKGNAANSRIKQHEIPQAPDAEHRIDLIIDLLTNQFWGKQRR
jgi:hypothetical protein